MIILHKKTKQSFSRKSICLEIFVSWLSYSLKFGRNIPILQVSRLNLVQSDLVQSDLLSKKDCGVSLDELIALLEVQEMSLYFHKSWDKWWENDTFLSQMSY